MGRLSHTSPLPEASQPRVNDSNVQRAFDLLFVPLREVLRFLRPFVQTERWKSATLLNSWANFSATYNTVQYRKDPMGRVFLRGLAKRTLAGYAGFPIFLLPVGYRPSKNLIFAVVGNNKFTRVDVTPDGAVSVAASDSATPEAFTSLDGITFDTVNE